MKKVIVTLVIMGTVLGAAFAQVKKPITQSRSAKTGKYVTKPYADKHKSTTVTSKKKK